MIRHTTYTWKFYTAGVEGKAKCSKCGSTITKYFSTQYREDSSPDLTECKKQCKEWENEEHVCNKCKKSKIKMGGYYICPDLSPLKQLDEKQEALNAEITAFTNQLREMLVDTVALYKNDEYVVDSISCYRGTEIYIYLYKINKRQPWYKTEKQEYFKLGGSGYKDIQFTDEVFSNRRKQLEE